MVCFCLSVDKDVLTVVEKPTIATHPTKFIPDIEKTTWPTFGGQPVRHTAGRKDHRQKKMTKNLLTTMANITGNLGQPSLMTKIALSLGSCWSDLLSGRSSNSCS
jgi:hypothetical protein